MKPNEKHEQLATFSSALETNWLWQPDCTHHHQIVGPVVFSGAKLSIDADQALPTGHPDMVYEVSAHRAQRFGRETLKVNLWQAHKPSRVFLGTVGYSHPQGQPYFNLAAPHHSEAEFYTIIEAASRSS